MVYVNLLCIFSILVLHVTNILHSRWHRLECYLVKHLGAVQSAEPNHAAFVYVTNSSALSSHIDWNLML